MCYYISQVKFLDDDYSHPEGPMIRTLTPVPFPTLGMAQAALTALLDDIQKNNDPQEIEVWGAHAIVLYNSHEPDTHVAFDNLFNSGDPSIQVTVDNLTSDTFNELADARQVRDGLSAPSRFRVVSLPAWDDVDPLSKMLASAAVDDFFENPDDTKFTDPFTGKPGALGIDVEGIQREYLSTATPKSDPSSLKRRGE